MRQVAVQDPLVLILAEGDTQGSASRARGHLFEQFTGRLLHLLGYEQPTTLSLNVTSSGVEIDVAVKHELDAVPALAECKAYTSPVKSEQLSTFYGKLHAERLKSPNTRGFMVAIPRLTSDGHELAKRIMEGDPSFRLLTAVDIWRILAHREEIVPASSPGVHYSDDAIIVHSSGIYAGCLEIDPETRVASRVLVRAKTGGVPQEVIRLLGEHDYSQGRPVADAARTTSGSSIPQVISVSEQAIVEVTGSKSDFEYQLPASPKFFVGRRGALADAKARLGDDTSLIVLNAQSGWGKSSLALSIAAAAKRAGGYAIVVDARTASTGAYVPAVLRRAAESAESSGLLALDPSASWASVSGALASLKSARWTPGRGRLVVFFDQFENVFKDEELTRQFRDLALLVLDGGTPLLIGFAWKTDFVGWTESHPYQLRDDIKNSASVLLLEPFGAADVDTILDRLQKETEAALSREIRQRLREYSQGLPWLLKKLSGHLIQELRSGKTQEQLVAEALNVANLFDSDLAHLSPLERESLNFIARYAPVQASEVTERYNAAVIQSLLDQRLVVQVGDKLDTYWDTFRDYLNTGRVPIEDSYILRQSPGSVRRLMADVIEKQGEAGIGELAASRNTSENVIWNVARELRQLGLALYKTNRVQLVPEILEADDREGEVRRRVVRALRRHKAFSAFASLADRGQGQVTTNQFAHRLEVVFPAVEVTSSTWIQYARVFLSWFEYAGLASLEGSTATLTPEGSVGKGSLTTNSKAPRGTGVFPTMTPGPCIAILRQLGDGPLPVAAFKEKGRRRALNQLLVLGAIEERDSVVRPIDDILNGGTINESLLKELLTRTPGGEEALALLAENPSAGQEQVGAIVRGAHVDDAASGTVSLAGKAFRGWARAAGVHVERGQRE